MTPQSLSHAAVRHSRSNTVVVGKGINPYDHRVWLKEYLPTRHLGENAFEICSIPFIVDNLAVGDTVLAEQDSAGDRALGRVLEPSGHYTFRVLSRGIDHLSEQGALAKQLHRLGCLTERADFPLLAVDAPGIDEARAAFTLLLSEEEAGRTWFEVARPRDDDDAFAGHLNPAGRGEAEYLIHAKLEPQGSRKRWEQLWVKRVATRHYRICCIPVFAYDLALGDEVETAPDKDALLKDLMQRVVVPSGHFTFRVWLGATQDARVRHQLIGELAKLGCAYEWYSPNLVAIDAAPDAAQQLADYLWKGEQLGSFTYETGRTQ